MKKVYLCLSMWLLASTLEAAAVVGPVSGPNIGVCGLSNCNYSVPADTSNHSYAWSVPAGAVINSGQGTRTVTVNFSNTYTPGYIRVVATHTVGTSSDSMLVKGYPAVPVLSPAGPYCQGLDNVYDVTSPNSASYFWNFPSITEFDVLSGDSSQIYAIWDVSGTIQARNSCGLSDALQVTVLDCAAGVTPPDNASVFNAGVYPNPASGWATLSFNESVTTTYQLILIDITGREVMVKDGAVVRGLNNVELNLENLSVGIYLINLITGEHVSRLRLAVR